MMSCLRTNSWARLNLTPTPSHPHTSCTRAAALARTCARTRTRTRTPTRTRTRAHTHNHTDGTRAQVDALVEPLSRKGPGAADKRYPQIRASNVH